MSTPASAGARPARLEDLRPALQRIGQAHVLAFADRLRDAERAGLAGDLATINLDALPGLIERFCEPAPADGLGELRPPTVCCLRGTPGDHAIDAEEARKAGLELVRGGRVAALTVAGGQGTRLGFDGPKGTLPIGPVSRRTLFEVFADQIAAASRWAGTPIPWLIMTSPQNHEQTIAFFGERDWLGLDRTQIRFFRQGVMPCFDPATGRLLLAEPHRLATNPDGHGGVVRALVESGELDRLERGGVEHISYFQVDNPLVTPIDPAFLGAHAAAGGARSSGQISSKMVPKAAPEEKVGLFARVAGRTRVVEYSDLPEEVARERTPDGRLRFEAGSVAIHAASVRFLREIHDAGERALPFHRAFKKVPYVDVETGNRVEPESPNAVKLERFVFDAVPVADESLVLRCEREREFAPVKNAQGVDSVATGAALQIECAARWLEERGHAVPRGDDGAPACTLELSGGAAWAHAAGETHEPEGTPAAGSRVLI